MRTKAAFVLASIAVAVASAYGCDRNPDSDSRASAPPADRSAATGASSAPASSHPSENIKPAEDVGKSGTVSGLPENGPDSSPATVGDQPADPDKKAR